MTRLRRRVLTFDAVALSGITAWYFFVPPRFSFEGSPSAVIALLAIFYHRGSHCRGGGLITRRNQKDFGSRTANKITCKGAAAPDQQLIDRHSVDRSAKSDRGYLSCAGQRNS